jgi:hypothetical protein
MKPVFSLFESRSSQKARAARVSCAADQGQTKARPMAKRLVEDKDMLEARLRTRSSTGAAATILQHYG